MRITSKRQFYDLWWKGLLGNKPRTWLNPMHAFDARAKSYSLREVGKPGGLFLVVQRNELLLQAFKLKMLGVNFSIEEIADPQFATLQGEICRLEGGWHGFLGVTPGYLMRDAKAANLLLPVKGLTIPMLLRAYCDPSSVNDIYDLLDLYPDAVIELTAYTRDIGILPNRNTIVWEVRNY